MNDDNEHHVRPITEFDKIMWVIISAAFMGFIVGTMLVNSFPYRIELVVR